MRIVAALIMIFIGIAVAASMISDVAQDSYDAQTNATLSTNYPAATSMVPIWVLLFAAAPVIIGISVLL